MNLFRLTVLLCLWISPFSHAETSPDALKTLNLYLIDTQVIPGYQALGEQVKTLHERSGDYCQKPDDKNLAAAREAFHKSMDAWQNVQFIRFGPIETMMRVHSIQFWPDKKHHVRKQLDQLIATQDVKALELSAMYRQPVSIRGLPAVEVLLFSQAPLSGFACQTLLAITNVLKEDTRTLAGEWRDGMRSHFTTFGDEEYYADAKEASAKLIGAVLDQLEFMSDGKLASVLGKSQKDVKVKQMESWRSERSLRNLRINLDSIQQTYRDASGQGLATLFTMEEIKALDARFAQLVSQINVLTQNGQGKMEQIALEPAGFTALQELAPQLRQLKQHLETLLKAHGVYLGFNSRDGD